MVYLEAVELLAKRGVRRRALAERLNNTMKVLFRPPNLGLHSIVFWFRFPFASRADFLRERATHSEKW